MPSAFDDCAQEYEQYRPGYPEMLFDDLIAAFSLAPGSLVVDLGTGTGRAAAPLARRGLRVIGIDPSPAMLGYGRRMAADQHLVNLEFRPGTAEETGLPEASADALTMAQAFHWVRPDITLAECQRVLKPGGGLAIFWNDRDLEQPHLGVMEQLILRYNPKYRSAYSGKPWGDLLAGSGRFQRVQFKQYRHASQIPKEEVIGLSQSFSYVRNTLSREETAAFERDLRALLAPYSIDGCVTISYITNLWYAFKDV